MIASWHVLTCLLYTFVRLEARIHLTDGKKAVKDRLVFHEGSRVFFFTDLFQESSCYLIKNESTERLSVSLAFFPVKKFIFTLTKVY